MAVRAAKESDLSEILAIYAPYVENTSITFDEIPPAATEFARYFGEITAQFPWLVWEEAGRILGYAHGSAPFSKAAYRWCAEVTVYLRRAARRRGIGRALYQALEACLTAQGYLVSYALVTSSNAASLAFHHAMGYRVLGELPDCGFKSGGWHSVTWLEKRLVPGKIPMDIPTPWPDFVKDDKNFSKILDKITLS